MSAFVSFIENFLSLNNHFIFFERKITFYLTIFVYDWLDHMISLYFTWFGSELRPVDGAQNQHHQCLWSWDHHEMPSFCRFKRWRKPNNSIFTWLSLITFVPPIFVLIQSCVECIFDYDKFIINSKKNTFILCCQRLTLYTSTRTRRA